MKSKAYIPKTIALVLCIITVTLSINIYLSYKDLYVSNNLPRDFIIYTAEAKTSLKNSSLSINDFAMPLIKIEEINNKSVIIPNKEDVQKKILINILILFLSFFSLASVHNFFLNEKDRKYNSKNITNIPKNKNHSIQLSSSLVSKEGA